MAGIYIHIPFCKQACNYCNFHFSTSLKHKDSLIDAILLEVDQRAAEWQKFQFDTIYFGGGTPSLLPVGDIEKLLNKLYQKFLISGHSEITLEGNPDDFTKEKLQVYRQMGINRLSIGVQSFFEEDLQKLNRSHNAQQAERSILLAQENGFDNITIDLIYGIPDLTDEKWLKNIQKTIDFNILHVSAYALTVEPKTALAWQILKQKFPAISEEQSARQFYILREKLLAHDFEHYEISNFAKKSFESKHNSHYWQNIPYLGLGPAAHSYKEKQRRWNVANNALYIKNITTGKYFETEHLTNKDIFNELIMTGLRTSRGVNLDNITGLGDEYMHYLQKQIHKYVENQQLLIENHFLKAAPESWFVVEGIISDLFMV